ncbi:TonB-dependent receptor [Ectopseudomonas hydrolytica]|uniref:TonB-dependent receptor n=1 Tax=Ectopseudomonas hydrolytica TaxID=2493633 RepID=A0ABY5A226_9GAMM|nr:TonB-dependent receptor [Pseudomonas hydrolytica]OCX15329.1 hypothetical protein BBI09_16270 [Stutzerimonas xanthomarina]USR37622.1 TonB-dependent receptor [Pseudomonas hydrolytica]
MLYANTDIPHTLKLRPLAVCISLALACSPGVHADEAIARDEVIEIGLPAGDEQATEQEDALELNSMVVEGAWETKDEAGRNDVYRKDVSNVYAGKDEIERYKGANVGDLFKGLNGVYSGDSRNSGALDPNIRGISGEGRIPVTVDGTEQATSVWMGSTGLSNRNYVDPNMIGSIAVEKGPSMTAGVRSGIGGSVEIKTLDVDDIVKPGESWGLEVKTETGTNSVKPNEDGMNNFGKDYRDIDGAFVGGNAVIFAKGGGAAFTPHESPRYNDFDFQDNAMRIALGTRQENFDLFAAYSYRNRGNYFSGKGGSKRYEAEGGLKAATEANQSNVQGDTSRNYIANLFLPGHEVAGTSSEMRTTLLKGTLYLPNEQSLKLSYMHSELEFGESMPYVINEQVRLQASGLLPSANLGFQFPYSEVKQDTFALNYQWNPGENRLLNMQAGLWKTHSDAERYQNGEELYTIDSPMLSDKNWDNYVRCSSRPELCPGGVPAQPEKLPNTDGRFNIVSRALQVSDHERWGVNLSNRMELTDSLALTLSGDFSNEKLQQKDYSTQNSGSIYTWSTRYLGPRAGKRQQYNFSFNSEWAATPWLVFNLGARYSDYNSFDTGLDEHRKNRDQGWGAKTPVIGRQLGYYRLLTDAENQAIVDNTRSMVESWGLDPATTEMLIAMELEAGKIDGVRYTSNPETVVVPLKGSAMKMDSAQNPFLNGSINLDEKVDNPQGTNRTVARYIPTPGIGGAVRGPELTDAERWARPEKRRDSAWAPMAGVTLHVTDYARLYARYSEFVRFPSIYEDTQAVNGGTYSVTDNRMRPEHAYNWEVGYVHDLRGFLPAWQAADFRLNYFNNEIRDFVDRDFAYSILQYDRKKLSGVELQSRFDTGRYFSGFSATYRIDQKLCDKDVAATFDPYYGKLVDECVTGGFPTTFSRTSLQPQYSLNLDSGMRLFNDRLELGARMIYHSSAKNKEEAKWIKQNLPFVQGGNEPFEWHPIWVFDAYAALRVNEHLDIDFGINNITNRYYIDPLARVAMPAPGRTMKLGLTARF